MCRKVTQAKDNSMKNIVLLIYVCHKATLYVCQKTTHLILFILF